MKTQEWQIIAGTVSSLLFAFSTFPMLLKAHRTRDLKSYSLGYLTMGNIGNLIHWAYVSSLPFGPIWILHSFYTVVTALMLFWYWRYERSDTFAALSNRLHKLQDRVNQQSGSGQVPIQQPVCSCAVPCPCLNGSFRGSVNYISFGGF